MSFRINAARWVGFSVLLLAFGAAGCDSSSTEPPSNQAPSARFTAEPADDNPMKYTFDAGASSDADGEIAAYQWEFGDGKSGSGKTVTHTYHERGEKDVKLTVVDEENAEGTSMETITAGEKLNFTSDYAYNLNVIYFVPADMEPLPNYRERMSGFLLYIQDYYRQWMNHWGYDKTFGLLKDEDAQRIKIYRIDGEQDVSAYSNGRTIREEVKDYFATNPDVSPDSKHYLVFTPKPDDLQESLPYYAIGKWGFVTDIGQNADKAPDTGGGVVHELGHALNLPHNAHRKSRKQELGTAIMHNGNNVWNHGGGASATSLTEASADILSQSQAFSREEGDFYGPIDAKLTSASGTYRDGEIVISGTFESDVPIQRAIVLSNPEGAQGYNQQGFSQPVIGTDSFHVSIPTSELFKAQNADHGAKVWLVPRHRGRVYFKLTDFSFEGGVPNIDFHYGEVATLTKENWEIAGVSDQETESSDRRAEYIIDGDFDTFWHSEYSPSRVPHPHRLTVKMEEQHEVEGFQFVQREAGGHGGGTRIKKLEIKVSDDGSNWRSLGTYTLGNTRLPQQIELDSTENFRYFRLITKSNWEDTELASLAEVGVF